MADVRDQVLLIVIGPLEFLGGRRKGRGEFFDLCVAASLEFDGVVAFAHLFCRLRDIFDRLSDVSRKHERD